MTTTDFSALFRPGRIGRLELENRLVMPAMASQLPEPDGRLSDRLLAYYRARAAGGAGLIIPAYAGVSADAPLMFNMGIYDDSWIDDWRRLIDTIHGYGVRVGVQLMHVGMLYLFAGFVPRNATMKIPSVIPRIHADIPHQVVSSEDIARYIDDFAQGARRAKEAGADLVEIHACHGSLAGMFMTPILNRRNDMYGGSLANRTRFPMEVIQRIKQSLGPDFPVSIRINGSDDLDGGTTPDQAAEQAVILESAGGDVISVSRGIEFWCSTTIPSYLYPNGAMLDLVDRIKGSVHIPVITAGKFTPELARETIAEGRADFIALGRPLLADPELPNKLSEGRLEEVRRCIYCMNCLNQNRRTGRGACSVNPFLNRESRLPLNPADPAKKVAVIGGGLAGMHTAAILAKRGHQVTIYEKEPATGGQWNAATSMPGKSHFGTLLEQLYASLLKHGVKIETGIEMTAERVAELKPDAVVIATGARPFLPEIPGIHRPCVVQAVDIITGKVKAVSPVVVLGGRYTAIETAMDLAQRGMRVSLVTRGELGQTMERMTLRGLQHRLIELDIPLYRYTPVLEIAGHSVIVQLGNEVASLPAETVVLALGMQPVNSLAKQLEGMVPEIYQVGDCVKPRNAAAVAFQSAQVAERI